MTLPHLFSETPQQPGYWNIGSVIINPMGDFFFFLSVNEARSQKLCAISCKCVDVGGVRYTYV